MTFRRTTIGIVLALCCAALPANAQSSDDGVDVELVEAGVGDCTNSDSPEGRIDCYRSLCEPSYRCVEALLRGAVKAEGPVLATTVLDDIMTVHQEFQVFSDGHELAHVIGRQLAKQFGSSGDAFLRCPRDYYYGCQHGFFEIVLSTSDSPVDAAQSVCESAPENQRFFCYHGVGHGFMMSYAYDLPAVLDRCNQIPAAEFKRQGCWQGAFMENINSFLRNEAREGVFDPERPLHPCDELQLEYQWECYYNHGSYLLRIHDHDVGAAAADCMGADDTTRPACTRGLGQLVGNAGWQKVIVGDDAFVEADYVKTAVVLCETFPAEERGNCVTGMVENMVNYELESDALLTCSLLGNYDGRREGCYRDLGVAMSRATYLPARRAEYCARFPVEYRSLCDPDGTVLNPPSENIFVRIGRAIGDFFSGLWRAITGLFAVSDTVPVAGHIPRSSSSSMPAEEAAEPAGDAVIRFDGEDFAPSEVTIAVGQTVTWINDSDNPFWPASNDHPTHQVYDHGAFDPKKPILGGGSWSFTFDHAGDWPFHDHLYPTGVGVVHVE